MDLSSIAASRAVASCAALAISHILCSVLVMFMDLSGRWTPYSLHQKRTVTFADYLEGVKSFCVDQLFLFLPFMTLCYSHSEAAISECGDTYFIAIFKLLAGYIIGKIWATGAHYLFHMPSLYKFHRRHHKTPSRVVASTAWEDSVVEYALMELPSFGITVLL